MNKPRVCQHGSSCSTIAAHKVRYEYIEGRITFKIPVWLCNEHYQELIDLAQRLTYSKNCTHETVDKV